MQAVLHLLERFINITAVMSYYGVFMPYIIAHDVGTSSIKSILFDVESLRVVYKVAVPLEVLYPEPGLCEQDPEHMWHQLVVSTHKLISESNVDVSKIKGIVMDVQMLGVIPISHDGAPLYNILTWLDLRSAGYPKELVKGLIRVSGYNAVNLFKFLRISGGVPSKTGKDPLSKIAWFKEVKPEIYRKTWKFLSVGGYLVYKLTGKPVISADEANVVWLVDARTPEVKWCKELAKIVKIDLDKLPEIRKPTEVVGELTAEAAKELGLPTDIKVITGCGDVAATAIGSSAVHENEVHLCLGSGDWLASHVSRRLLDIFHAIGCLVSAIPGKYLLIADQATGCSPLDYFVKQLYETLDKRVYDEVDSAVSQINLARSNIVFLPWMFGERVPIEDPYARGALFNLSLSHNKAEIVSAVMEGIAYNIKWAHVFYEKLLGVRVNEVFVVGGCSLYNSLCQILANTLGIRVLRVSSAREASAIGAAIIGLVGLGLGDFDIAKKIVVVEREFNPDRSLAEIYNRKFKLMVKLYKKTRSFFRELNR